MNQAITYELEVKYVEGVPNEVGLQKVCSEMGKQSWRLAHVVPNIGVPHSGQPTANMSPRTLGLWLFFTK